MKTTINKLHPIPTGYLFTSNCSKGELETLSIGDYGKAFNVRAPFLGYHDPIAGVPNNAGFDVLIFVPSMDEEDGLVTCGNLILGGSTLKSNPSDIIKIKGI